MPCANVKIGNITAVVCGLPKRKRCFYCGKISGYLCDFPTRKLKNGKWKTCDRALCKNCRQKGISFDVDFCPEHYPKALAAYQRRRDKCKIIVDQSG